MHRKVVRKWLGCIDLQKANRELTDRRTSYGVRSFAFSWSNLWSNAPCSLSEPRVAVQHQTLADLPVAAQHAISSAIGQDQSAYHAASAAAGVTLANPANGFTAQVQSGALHVSAGSDTWDMSLAGLGYGGAVQPVGTAQTSASGNRVDCNYGTIDEWYVNGPGGLEQGFTVAPLPQSDASGSLTVELALGGDLTGTVNAAGDGLTLSRPDGSAALGYTGLAACDATGRRCRPRWKCGPTGAIRSC